MARTNKTSPEVTAEAEAQAAKDRALLEQLEAKATEAEEAEEPEQTTTIADLIASMNDIVVHERKRTRLAESTLTKSMELAMNFHVWNVQRQEAAQRQAFDPSMFMGTSGEKSAESDGPVNAGEFITEATSEEPNNGE